MKEYIYEQERDIVLCTAGLNLFCFLFYRNGFNDISSNYIKRSFWGENKNTPHVLFMEGDMPVIWGI